MLSRTAPTAVRAVRVAGVRRSINPSRVRYNSTNAGQDGQGTALTAGMVGGAVAFGAAYGWYHLSGTAKVVESAKTMQQKFETVKQATPSPTSAASFLRSIIESQLAAVPGAKAAFQKFDELAEVHGDEVSDIISKTYNEIWETVEKGGDDVSGKVAEILKKRGAQLKDVGVDAGDRILSEHPEVKEKLGYAFDEVKGWTDQYGPEAKKQAEEVYSEIQKIVSGGLSMESITRAKKLVEEKRADVEKLGKKAAQQAYEKGEQQAQEVLKKYPEVKDTLYKYKDQLIGGGVSVSAIPMIFKQVSGLKGSGEENAQKLKDYIEDTIEKGKKKGSQFADSDTLKDVVGMAQKYLKSIPGGDKILEQVPDLEKFAEIAKKKGPEAEKLATETWEEISKVLSKKYKEAEELAQDSQKQAKKN